MLSEEELQKVIESLKNTIFYKEYNNQEIQSLKEKCYQGDISAEFEYGEQCYYNKNYIECAYWIAKAFHDNNNYGKLFFNDLKESAIRKIKDKFVSVIMKGYGYVLDSPVNVSSVYGETIYLKNLRHNDGEVIYFKRLGSKQNLESIVDEYELLVVSNPPKFSLQRYLVYFNMYAKNNDETLIKGFKKLQINTQQKNVKKESSCDNSSTNKKNKEKKMIIHKTFGLDLGTTNSTASVFINGNNFCAEDAKQKSIPSIVGIKGDQFIVGAAAKNNVNLSKIRSIKRKMGKDEKIVLSDKKFKPEEISAEIIKYCADLLNKQIDKSENVIYDRIVITVPAYFSAAQKDATRKAGELAGLKVIMLLEEPTAAAINYTVKNNISTGVYMVYDLGGGTFDVSIIEKIENIPVVLATAGNNFLGGDNFDNMLARYFIDVLNNDLGYEIDNDLSSTNPHQYNALLLAAENVKKNLSQNDTYTINYYDVFKDNSGIDLIIEDFSRQKFESIIENKILVDTFNECQKAIDIFTSNGRAISEIDGILMVGGSSHIPYVKQAIREKYIDSGMIKEIIVQDPDLAVGYGAGIVAATQSTILENIENNISVEINAPYLFDDITNISGKVLNGDISKIGLISNGKEWTAEVNDDKSFSVDISDNIVNLDYKFYNGDKEIISMSEAISGSNLIAPTPVQNETIRIEIIDLDKQEIENFPLVNKGESLPCSATHNFKVNEFSRQEIILPVKEGYREIYTIKAQLPENTEIGSRITIKTEIDILGKVSLTILLNNKQINGQIIYSENKEIGSSFNKIDTQYYNKIMNVSVEQKDKFVSKREDIVRELKEAEANADTGHYTDVMNKYETLVNELPNQKSDISEEDFDNIYDEIKQIASKNKKINLAKIEDEVYFGKRALSRKDYAQAQERYQSLCSTREVMSIPNNVMFLLMLKQVTEIMKDAENIRYSISDNSLISAIDTEIDNINMFLNSIDFENLDKSDEALFLELTQDLISKSRRLFVLLEKTGVKEINEKVQNFQGRISKE